MDMGQKQKLIGHPNDAKLIIQASASDLEFLRSMDNDSDQGESLAGLFRVSGLELTELEIEGVHSNEIPGLVIRLERAEGDKCERCWLYSPHIGVDPEYSTICPRCTRVVRNLDN